MRLRVRDHTYSVVRTDELRWDLSVDGANHSSHQDLPEARRAAAAIDKRSRTRRAVVPHILILAAASLLLAPVLIFREVANPAYGPARTFADRMEDAYRAVNAGEAEITDFTLSEYGFEGGLFTIDRGGVVADYRLLVGQFDDDCYLVRWRHGRAPLVARLLPRYPCVSGDPALSFDPAGFEAVAINTSLQDPPNWDGVLPAQIRIATWVLPAVIALLYIVLRQLVSLSLVLIRGVATKPVDVVLIDDNG